MDPEGFAALQAAMEENQRAFVLVMGNLTARLDGIENRMEVACADRAFAELAWDQAKRVIIRLQRGPLPLEAEAEAVVAMIVDGVVVSDADMAHFD